MAKQKRNLNSIYISERLRDVLRPISKVSLTAVVAPIGYGKTTAVNWFLSERAKAEKTCVVRISVYSDNLVIFWKSVQEAFFYAGYEFLKEYPCPADDAELGLLTDELCHMLDSDRECYIYIDDYHLLMMERVSQYICLLANCLPENVHLIVASRNDFLPAEEVIRLGRKVYRFGKDELCLKDKELAGYAYKCGVTLSDAQLETLLHSSEGWFSAVYLNLTTFLRYGRLPDKNSDIYSMFTMAMINPLTDVQREFVAIMGLADEFTLDMASYILGDDFDVEALLKKLTAQNAFISKLPDGNNYRFHHMMKECAEREFEILFTKDKQNLYIKRYGMWYENRSQYLQAIAKYRICEDYHALLRVVQSDAGIRISTLSPQKVLLEIEKIHDDILMEHPLAILVLMRCMFNWRQIPKMLQLKEKFLESVSKHPHMDSLERGNLLGECDLIMSFLMFNDISAMSALHRSASSRMSRPAISISNTGGWTFGSPSVLMQYYREPGALAGELEEMFECMPHYYKITNGHGQGAEWIMSAEAKFLQGKFQDAQIELETAYEQSNGNAQHNIAICADFLSMRLLICEDIQKKYTFNQRYRELVSHHNPSLIYTYLASCAYYYALCHREDKIPDNFRLHKMEEINTLAPGKPMIDMIENQVYLVQGAYAKVIGRYVNLSAVCENMHYALVSIHLKIQVAAAYEMLGKHAEAEKMLETAIREAVPDCFVMPFAENYCYIKNILKKYTNDNASFIERIDSFGKEYEQRLSERSGNKADAKIFDVLTERENTIVKMMSKRLSNREIAEQLFLSEGTIKQYINQIYSKLHIAGDTRTKRRALLAFLDSYS